MIVTGAPATRLPLRSHPQRRPARRGSRPRHHQRRVASNGQVTVTVSAGSKARQTPADSPAPQAGARGRAASAPAPGKQSAAAPDRLPDSWRSLISRAQEPCSRPPPFTEEVEYSAAHASLRAHITAPPHHLSARMMSQPRKVDSPAAANAIQMAPPSWSRFTTTTLIRAAHNDPSAE